MARSPRILGAFVQGAFIVSLGGCIPAQPVGGPAPRSILVLPPVSTRLDPLVPEGRTGVREADRVQIVDAVETTLPLAVHDRLVGRGIRAVVIRPEDLTLAAAELEQLEDRLSYAGMARAYQVERVLKLTYDGSIRRGAGTVEYLDGLIAMDYPSDTAWYELRVEATLVDPASAENLQTIEVSGKRHSELITMLGGETEHDRLSALVSDLAERVVDQLLGS